MRHITFLNKKAFIVSPIKSCFTDVNTYRMYKSQIQAQRGISYIILCISELHAAMQN